nr:helix-turn-helix domain-containing protein [uncultured Enterobacter sp.]
MAANGHSATVLACAPDLFSVTFSEPVEHVMVSMHPLCELAAFLDECLQLNNETVSHGNAVDAAINNEEQLRHWFMFNFMMGRSDAGFDNLVRFIRKKESYFLSRYLIQNRCSAEKVQSLCQTYGLSYSYFRKVAKKYLGVSAKTKLSEWRLAQTILDILDGDDSITDIALKNGFSSSAHVCATFKATLGLTPYEIRKINEKG